MPVSLWLGVEYTLDLILSYHPWSVLDVGIGFGLWGHLLRQYLDVWHGRTNRSQWLARIDGIEIDGSRVQDHTKYLYSQIHIGDATRLVPICCATTDYDIILFGDVLEHLPKTAATRLLDRTVEAASCAVVVRIPLGNGWRRRAPQSADSHRSQWSVRDFSRRNGRIQEYRYNGRPYAVIALGGVDGLPTTVRDLKLLTRRVHAMEKTLTAYMASSRRREFTNGKKRDPDNQSDECM